MYRYKTNIDITGDEVENLMNEIARAQETISKCNERLHIIGAITVTKEGAGERPVPPEWLSFIISMTAIVISISAMALVI